MCFNVEFKMFDDDQEEEKYDYPDPLEEENFKRIIRADKKHLILKTFLEEILKFDVIHIGDIDSDYFAIVKNENGEYWCYYVTVGNANFRLNGMKIVIKD
ncbi:MAG: hypothetical protein ACI4PE_02200 [Bacilli bacterium]